jgi:hypothetical protein
LCKDHRQILVPTREAARIRIAAIAGYALLKFFVRQEFDQLREDGEASVHTPLFRHHREAEKRTGISNRSRGKWLHYIVVHGIMRSS